MRLPIEMKIQQLLQEYPEVEALFKEYFKYFYDERLDEILFKRLSVKGALNILELDEAKKEEFLEKFNKMVTIKKEVSNNGKN